MSAAPATPPTPVRVTFPPELPVSKRRDDIARAISDNQVVIVAGETGSGKTTQLPKILLELGYQSIGHTQPRRIAARTIAERIADELGQQLGGLVGYQVRFTDRVGPDTRIKLMTDGILLNEIHRDRMLRKYDAIIIDEAHERSLTIDFLLGYLKQLLPMRPELKLIITSATIDPESFSRHFGGAPIVEVSGRTYPVEIRYRPLVAEAALDADDEISTAQIGGAGSVGGSVSDNRDYLQGITDALDELAREAPGDVLVFLSGENEIRDAEEAIRGRISAGSLGGSGGAGGSYAGSYTEVLPLYGRLSSADQHRVFQPSATAGARRRIVLATNVAETSLTVPGIRYVIDAGTARISRYSVRAKIQRLPIEPISQASANQRSGRSGRTSDGIAIRLYSREDFESRPEYTEPEILRTNLAAVILQMISLGLGEIEAFPFLQPPDSRGIKDGLELLRELRAVELDAKTISGPRRDPSADRRPGARDTGPRITRIGKQLAQVPLDPRLARMVIESKQHGVTREVLAIVAGLSIQDPRERPLEKRQQADEKHARFTDPTSDFLSLLALWNYLETQQIELSGNAFRRLCKAEFLNYLRVREWQDVYRQLTRASKNLGLSVGEASVNPDGIHRSMLSGLLSQIGLRDAQKKDYLGARNQRFVIFPGSGLAKKQPNAVMAAELIETSRLFARTVAAIDPAWAESLAGDLVKRTYSEPHWEKKQGAAVAWERATLYGVPIVQRRRAQYSRIDPAHARELFIRHALVDGDWDVDRLDRRITAFDRANRALRAQLAEVEERTRRRDILYDDEAIVAFYERHIPGDVCSTRTFETWWRKQRAITPDLLTMVETDLVDKVESVGSGYPASWHQGDQTLALGYRFEPGAEDDGVTAEVPIALLAQLSPTGFDWLVPGLRIELVTALIKTLPKSIRRNVVPASDWATKLLDGVPDAADLTELPLTDYLAEQIQRMTYTPVSAADFEPDRLPQHLRMTFAVVDERGQVLARSKDLDALQSKLAARARTSVARVSASSNPIERSGISAWDFGELPSVLDTRVGGSVIRGYPTLVDEGSSVAIRVVTSSADQTRLGRGGIRRLLLLTVPSPLSYVREHLSQTEKLTLSTSPYGSVQALFDDCLLACIDHAMGDALPRDRAQFDEVRDRVSASLLDGLFATVSDVTATLSAARDADRALRSATSLTVLPSVSDARGQLDGLVFAGFVGRTGVGQLRHLPRYLRGISARMGKLPTEVARDRVWMTEVQAATGRFEAAGGSIPLPSDAPEKLVRARWLLEEFRVSLFAQHLGTAESVSLQRITRALV